MAGPDDLEDDIPDPLDEDLPPEDDTDLLDEGDDLAADAPEGDDFEEIEPDARQPRKPSRAETRFQKLANERNELRERLARLEGERDASSRHQAPPPDPRIAQAEEAALLSTMTAEEKITYFDQKVRRETAQFVQSTEQRLADRLDKMEFRDLCRDNKAFAKVASKVEELKKQYPGVAREALAKFAIGEAFVNGGLKKAEMAAERSAQTVRRQRGKPPAGGSDVGTPDRRGAPKTAKERLESAEAKGLRW